VGTFEAIRQKVAKLYQRTEKKKVNQAVQDQHRLRQATILLMAAMPDDPSTESYKTVRHWQ
jgi:hypothetical protein